MGNCAKDREAYRHGNSQGLDAYNQSLSRSPQLKNYSGQNINQQNYDPNNMPITQSAIIRRAKRVENNQNPENQRQITITITEPNSKSDPSEVHQNVESVGRPRSNSKDSIEDKNSSQSSYLNPNSRAYIAGLQVISEASMETSIRRFDMESEAERREQFNLPYSFSHANAYHLHSEIVKGESNHIFGPIQPTQFQWRYQF